MAENHHIFQENNLKIILWPFWCELVLVLVGYQNSNNIQGKITECWLVNEESIFS